MVRRFGARWIAPKEQEVESRYLLGYPTYLKGKPGGETSMLGKRLNTKVCSVRHRKSCTQEASKEVEVKPGLVEPQFPRA
jgi:hypothetical protein